MERAANAIASSFSPVRLPNVLRKEEFLLGVEIAGGFLLAIQRFLKSLLGLPPGRYQIPNKLCIPWQDSVVEKRITIN